MPLLRLLERDPAVYVAVKILASDFEPAEQFFASRYLCCRHARELGFYLGVEEKQALRQGQKFFLEAARLKLSAAALCERRCLRQDRPVPVGMEAREEVQPGRFSPGRVERCGERRRRSRASLQQTRCGKTRNTTRQAWPSRYSSSTVAHRRERGTYWSRPETLAANDPLNFAANDGLNRQRTGEIFHDMTATGRMKHEIVVSELRAGWK